MARGRVRTVILCEDRAHEHFLRRLCEALQVQPLHVLRAPAGVGSAEQWVRRRYAEEVRKHRGRGDQLVGLVVMTDGDRFGVAARKQAFAVTLAESGQRARDGAERIALCIPTWSIETWFAWFDGREDVDEATSYKQAPGLSPARAAGAWQVVRASESSRVSSLVDARGELRRLAP